MAFFLAFVYHLFKPTNVLRISFSGAQKCHKGLHLSVQNLNSVVKVQVYLSLSEGAHWEKALHDKHEGHHEWDSRRVMWKLEWGSKWILSDVCREHKGERDLKPKIRDQLIILYLVTSNPDHKPNQLKNSYIVLNLKNPTESVWKWRFTYRIMTAS